MDKRRAHVWITGRVQGVFFRAYARDAAHRIGITGWVRNLLDGRVEAVFEGDAERVEQMIAWCHEGSPMGRVDSVEVVQETYTGEFYKLTITR
jgi:acylphosphatase